MAAVGLVANSAHGETAPARTCHVTYYCGTQSGGEIGPIDTTAGVEERQCATNSSRVIDSLRSACAVRGTLRVAFAIWGETPPVVNERCTIGFRCPGNAQTIQINANISRYACNNGAQHYVGNWRGYQQDIPYYRYHNEFIRSVAGLCPSTNDNPNRVSRSVNPTSIETVTWRLPQNTDGAQNPSLSCRCFTRCYGSRSGWVENVSYAFQTPYNPRLCNGGDNSGGLAQNACRAAGADSSQGSANFNSPCVGTFSTGQLNGATTPTAGTTSTSGAPVHSAAP